MTVAIIPAAGKGTRFLPLTRAVPKEMLPVGAKPAIQLIAEEAVRAGARRLVVVISEGKELIRRYLGETDLGVETVFAYQREQRGLGHAVLQARDAAAGADRLLVLLGDALVSGCDAAREMVALSDRSGGAGVVGLEHVPPERVSRYGIVRMQDGLVVDLVEKPRPEEAPSDLAIAGRYLLPADIFAYLADQPAGYGGEIQLTDAIRRSLAGHPLLGYVYPGRRHDIGNPDGYFETLRAYHHDHD